MLWVTLYFLLIIYLDLETERQLVYEAKTDFSSFDRLYDYYFPKVYGFVYNKIQDHQKTEDLVSEVFVKILEALPKFEWKNVPFGAWIFRIVRNHLHDYYGKSAKDHTALAEDFDIQDDSRHNQPHTVAHLNEVEQVVVQELKKLNETERTVVEMKFFVGMKNKEIAGLLATKENNVGIILFRALKKLKGPLSQLNL